MVFAAQCATPCSRVVDARRVTRASRRRAVAAAHVPGVVMPEGDPNALNKWSRKITQPKSQGASQAMLYATGLTPEQMNLPQIGASRTRDEGGRRGEKARGRETREGERWRREMID